MLEKFIASRSGNFGILTGAALIPLCLAAGLSVDYSRHTSAQRHLQEIADATSLALAATKEQNQEKLELLAADYLVANYSSSRVQQVSVASVIATADAVDVDLRGSIPTTFMGIAGYDQLDVAASALAERAINGTVEVSLILDNTYSMSDASSGKSRISVLKTAANKLVDGLMTVDDGAVRIAVVPYADYVNVGLSNRKASWLSVQNDYSTSSTSTPAPRTCETRTTKSRCIRTNPTYACTADGVPTGNTCGGGCAEWETYTVAPYEYCTGGGEPKTTYTHYKFYGCVDSRIGSDNRLHNKNSTVKFVGRLTATTEPRCMTPVLELSNNKTTVKAAIDGMIIERSGYRPNTYIPAGLIWGLNTLAPEAPFTTPSAYDPANRKPRKVAVLMTDGANTMQFNSNGSHSATTNATNLGNTNTATTTICTNMKTNGIEIFTIAFMVDDAAAKTMLQGCATDPTTHYFDASDRDKLLAAFDGIAQSLRVVRLAR